MAAERDWPEGHPASADYDPRSEAARRWKEEQARRASERDYPAGHPGAADNPDRVEPTHPADTARDYSRGTAEHPRE
jgi:hypothetical protein